MKVTKIHIQEFQQFRDFGLELTYPDGHEKAGQPLEKVCLLGQSGTGKTTLLEIIRKSLQTPPNPNNKSRNYNSEDDLELVGVSMKGKSDVLEVHQRCYESGWKSGVQPEDVGFIYFPAEISQNLNPILNEERKVVGGFSIHDLNQVEIFKPFAKKDQPKKYNFTFGPELAKSVWSLLMDPIVDYQKKEAELLFEIGLSTTEEASDERLAKSNYQNWKNSTPNPLEELSHECLNPILQKMGLRVRPKLHSLKEVAFLPIETLDGRPIPSEFISTGTKQISLLLAPLFLIKPENAIILIDEPERSLYPDIQSEIIKSIISQTKDSQLIVATHSPLIAASFDPWEIVELKFDYENGCVFQEQYFEGERHVDNYKFYPKYLRYDSILRKIFDLDSDSHPDREEKLDELAELGAELDMLKEEGKLKSKEAERKWADYRKLAEKTDFWIASEPGAKYGEDK
ncbi:MAG: ATP-binding protein [Bacteroidia bacterium]|nr:ATP-binding protein [Bacteroidia bacterium]